MKTKVLAFLVVTLLLATSACQNPFSPANQVGTLSLTTGTSGTGERSILPSGMSPASYHLSGSGPSSATLSQDSTSGSFSVSNIAAGDWTLTVTGLDASNNAIVSGSTTATIAVGKTTSVSIKLAPVSTGTGTLALTVDWSAVTMFSVASVSATLTPDSGSATSLTFTTSGTTATCSQASLATGSYLLSIEALNSSSQVVARTLTDTVLIYNGQTSTGSISLSNSDCGYRVIYSSGTADSGSAPTDTNVYASGTKITLLGNTGSLIKANYIFVGWNTSSDGNGTLYAVGSTLTILNASATLYPKWSNVAYDANGATKGTVPVDMNVYSNNGTVTMLDNTGSLSKNGYVFSGWTTTANTGKVYSATGTNTTYTKSDGTALTTFYARWTPCVASVSACGDHTLIVTTAGSLYACGNNNLGQLGDGGTTTQTTPKQVVATGVRSAAGACRYISGTMNGHSYVVYTDGTLKVCGYNSEYSQLGTGDSVNKSLLTAVSLPSSAGVASVSAGARQALILGTDNNFYACGDNASGELGLGTISATATATPTIGTVVTGVAMVSGGLDFSAILTSGGSLFACGVNDKGQLGDASTTTRSAPVAVSNMTNVSSVSAGGLGGDAGFMLIVNGGSLYVCGYNGQGQLGTGTTSTTGVTTPQKITSVSNVASVSAGPNFSLVLTTDGTLYACGSNARGQFGIGSSANIPSLTKIATKVASISAGGYYTSANYGYSMIVKTDGSLWAAGNNAYGQLGDGTTTDVTTWKQISF